MNAATRNALPLAFFSIGFFPMSSQVVWTVPAFPTQYDEVTVYFNATEGNGALSGYTDDVYAHTGVITSESAHANDWQHVIGNWGTHDARVLMTREAPDLYSISYHISDFYGVPDGEEVFQMAFVFRNLNGTIVGRAFDGSDIFTPVFPSDQGLFITLRSPDGPDLVKFEDDSLLIDVAVSDTVMVSIYDNGELIFNDTVDRAFFYHQPLTPGIHELRVEAMSDTLVFIEESYFVAKRNPVLLDPPLGTGAGINYHTDSTFLFQLHAPLKSYAFLLTSANGYKPDSAFQMHLATDESTFWIEVPKAAFKEKRNTYQYLVEDGIRIADPHSEVILDPQNDAWISNDVMAALPPYPDGMTSGIVTAFDTLYTPFPFTVNDFEKPAKTKLIIYELLLRDFLAKHDFETLLDTLDYFVRLGITAIELMPVNEFEGNISWGYNPSFHMAVDKYYGTREQLKMLIDAAHARGIAVILDVVFNHTFSQGPLARMYWDPVHFRPAPQSPYLNVVPRHPFNVGYDFNHESPATQSWVKRILQHWIMEFRFDGFRFDLSKGLTQFNSGNDAGLMAQYDAGRIAILKTYADHIWSLDSTAYVIMEHFADNNEEIELSNYGMMLWGNINYAFNQAAKGFQSDLDWADYRSRGWDDPHLIPYMESHDEERMMFRTLNEGDSEGDYNTRLLPIALQRMAAAAVIYFSLPGPKMIWQFGEMGYDFSINRCTDGTIANECRLDPKPIRWDYMTQPDRQQLWNVYAALNHLRTAYPTFSTEDYLFNDGNLFLKTVHLQHPDMDAVTLVNYRVINSDINPKFQYPGTWYEYFTGDSLVVTDTQERITFRPGEYRIYTSRRIAPPNGYFTSVSDFALKNIALFPNPTSTRNEIFALLQESDQVANVYLVSTSGQGILLSHRISPEGFVILHLPQDLASGIWAVQIQTERSLYFGKLVIARNTR